MNGVRYSQTTALACLALISAQAFAQSAPGGGAPSGVPLGPMPAMPSMDETTYQASLVVRDGQLQSGQGAATFSKGLAIASDLPRHNGVIVSGGRSAYTLEGAQIRLGGVGQNDFLGIGAGAMVRAGAAMVVERTRIETSGATASAVVAAEGATLRVYDSVLIANGGPLPVGYVRKIGPGMMEPPAPLGLDGNARTVLALSNSRSFFYNTTIEADGWGALSTDATGGNLYLEANDCVVKVRRRGYGAYADFGAHVVLNRTQVDSRGEGAIIAGKARIDLNGVTLKAGRNGVMIHSVMSPDPFETAELNLKDTDLVAAGPGILVKSANAAIVVDGGSISSTSGQILSVIRNDDPNATKTGGAKLPGVSLTLRKTGMRGAIVNADSDRTLSLTLDATQLAGALRGVRLTAAGGSRWLATDASDIELANAASVAAIDAMPGVTVRAISHDAAVPVGSTKLTSGGMLQVTAS